MVMALRQNFDTPKRFGHTGLRPSAPAHPTDWDGAEMLLSLVDFKWLMAAVGWRVDLTRLRGDLGYADDCLRLGLDADSEMLRLRCEELLDKLRSIVLAELG